MVTTPSPPRASAASISAKPGSFSEIFEEFADGRSPRAIAKQLNIDHFPGPDGRPWGDTTIRGQADRGTRILNNALYVGRLEWTGAATSRVRAPQTGRAAQPSE